MKFFYWLPGLIDYRERFPHAFDAPPATMTVGASMSPEGQKSGVIYFDHDCHPNDAVELVWMTWQNFWVGMDRTSPPTPGDLFNGTALHQGAGARVRLGDGNQWTVPRAVPCRDRDPERPCGLPQAYAAGVDGSLGGSVLKPRREYEPTVEALESMLGGQELAEDSATNVCAQLLSVCYRVALAEVLFLELLDHESAMEVAAIAIDQVERTCVSSPELAEAIDGLDLSFPQLKLLAAAESEGLSGDELRARVREIMEA